MNTNPLPIKNPYKGPAFFTSDDEGIFHGRKQETRDLVSMVSTERVVLFYAQSGAGKTSLLNAGLIPKLRRKRYEVLPRSRVIGAPYVPDGVRNIFTYNVMLHLVEGDANPEQLQQLTLSDFLWHLSTTDGKDYFYDPSDEAMRLAVPKQKLWPRVLILDQFEELVTHYPTYWRHRPDFFRQLDAALQSDPLLRIVITLRSDYVSDLERWGGLLQHGLRARYHMLLLNKRGALDAVAKPAEQVGRPYFVDPDSDTGVAEALVKNLSQVRGQDERGNLLVEEGECAEPIQLQVVCEQLWESLLPGDTITMSDLRALVHRGSHTREMGAETYPDADDHMLSTFVDGALTSFYDTRLKQALAAAPAESDNPDLEAEVRRLFSTKLTTSTGTRGLVQRGTEATDRIPDPVIESLVDSHLLRSERRGSVELLELIHDRFVDPIRQSNRRYEDKRQTQLPWIADAHRWYDSGETAKERRGPLPKGENLSVILQQADGRHFEPAVEEYLTAAKEAESRRNRQDRNRAFGLAAIVCVLAVFAAMGWWTSKQNEKKLEVARSEAVGLRLVAEADKADDSELALALAIQANRIITGTPRSIQIARASLVTAVLGTSVRQKLETETDIYALDYDPDTNRVLIGGNDGSLTVWNLEAGTKEKTLEGHCGTLLTVAISEEGRFALSGDERGNLLVWDLGSDQATPLHKLSGNTDPCVQTEGVWRALFRPVPIQQATLQGGDDSVSQQQALSAGSDKLLHLWDLETGTEIRTFSGHKEWIYDLDISADGTLAVSGSDDGEVRLWELELGESTLLGNHGEWVRSVAISPDGKQVLSGSRQINLWSTEATDPQSSKTSFDGAGTAGGLVYALRFAPDGATFYSAGSELRRWDVETSTALSLVGHKRTVRSLSLRSNEDGELSLVSGSLDQAAIHWDLETGRLQQDYHIPIRTLQIAGSNPAVSETVVYSSTQTSSDSPYVLAWGNGRLDLWDKHLGNLLVHRAISLTSVSCMTLMPSLTDALVQRDGAPSLQIDLLSGVEEEVQNSECGSDIITNRLSTAQSLRPLSASGIISERLVFVGTPSNGLFLWDMSTDESFAPKIETHFKLPISSIAPGPGGNSLIIGSFDGTLGLWSEPNSFSLLQSSGDREPSPVYDIAVDSRRTIAVSAHADGKPVLWDLDQKRFVTMGIPPTLEPTSTSTEKPSTPTPMVRSTPESAVASQRAPGAPSESDSTDKTSETSATLAVAISAEGNRVLTGSSDGYLYLWRLDRKGETLDFLDRLIDQNQDLSPVWDVAISPDGRRALSAHKDGRVIMWSLGNKNEELKVLIEKDEKIDTYTVAFDPNGIMAMSGNEQGQIRLWKASTGDAIPVNLVHPDRSSVVFGSFSQDGERVVTMSTDRVFIWNLIRNMAELVESPNRYYHELSCADWEDQYFITHEDLPDFSCEEEVGLTDDGATAQSIPTPASDQEAEPIEKGIAHLGENRGDLALNTRDLWQFHGPSDAFTIITAMADRPASGVNILADRVERRKLDTSVNIEFPESLGLDPAENDDIVQGRNTNGQVVIGPLDSQASLGTHEPYTVEVSAFDNATSGPYSLQILSAMPISIGVPVSDEFGIGAQGYWYFEGIPGDSLQIDLESSEPDTYLKLYDSMGKLLNHDVHRMDGPARLDTLLIARPGKYLIIAGALGNLSDGRYNLSITRLTTKPISFDRTVEGTFDSSTVWTFDDSAGQLVTIEFNPTDDSTILPGIRLLDRNGNEITRSEIGSGQRNIRLPLVVLPSSGFYSIIPSAQESAGGYTLTLSRPPTRTISLDEPTTEDLSAGIAWVLNALPNTSVDVRLEDAGDGIDPVLVVFGSNGSMVAMNDDSNGYNSLVTLEPSENQRIIVPQEFSQRTVGRYRLIVTEHVEQQ